MKLKTKFVVLITAIHLIMLIFSTQLLTINKFLFLASELLILLSIYLSYQLYKAFIRPINLISAGIESLRDKDFSMKFVPVGQMEIDQLVQVYNQMIEQMREERIRQEEQHFFLQRLIEASPTAIIVLDFDDKIAAANPAAEQLFSMKQEKLTGQVINQLIHPLASTLASLQADDQQVISRKGIELYACRKSHFLDRGFHKHFIMIEELSEEIRQIEKTAYEKVIRMMSHEINNSIGAVNSIMDSFKQYGKKLKADDRSEFQQALDVVTKRNNRLNSFMSNFSDVVRLPPPVRKETDLIALINSVKILVKNELADRQISWTDHYSDQKLILDIDAEQFEHVLINAVKNAWEAIESDGDISIILENNALILRDNGPGIPAEQSDQLFTPFYSSKKDGQGIGLTLIREILANHGFGFSLTSTASSPRKRGHTDFKINFN